MVAGTHSYPLARDTRLRLSAPCLPPRLTRARFSFATRKFYASIDPTEIISNYSDNLCACTRARISDKQTIRDRDLPLSLPQRSPLRFSNDRKVGRSEEELARTHQARWWWERDAIAFCRTNDGPISRVEGRRRGWSIIQRGPDERSARKVEKVGGLTRESQGIGLFRWFGSDRSTGGLIFWSVGRFWLSRVIAAISRPVTTPTLPPT